MYMLYSNSHHKTFLYSYNTIDLLLNNHYVVTNLLIPVLNSYIDGV